MKASEAGGGTTAGWRPTVPCRAAVAPCFLTCRSACMQVIVERADKSNIPDIDKKK